MAILFENIKTKETYAIDQAREGKFFLAKLSALMNSSNMSPNADRGQDFGIRLAPEQQALIENWENDPTMIERVSKHSGTMVDDLTHAEFLGYMLYQQGLGHNPERSDRLAEREAQRDYEARVEALRVAEPKEIVMAPFNASSIPRGEATVEDFLRGDVTGDASGDKAVEEDAPVTDEQLAELEKAIESTTEPPVIEAPVVQAPKAPKTPKAKK